MPSLAALGYPVNEDGVWTDPGSGAYSLYVRDGGQQKSIPSVIGNAFADANQSALRPVMMYTVGAQGISASVVNVLNPTGCPNPTGLQLPIAEPITSPIQRDSYGLPTPSSAQPGDTIATTATETGQLVGTHIVRDATRPPKRQPFTHDLYPGDAIGLKEYGLYQWVDANGKVYPILGKADPTVRKPEINLLYNKSQFTVNPKTNELNLNTNGGSDSAYGQGKNILLIPGAPPTLPMTVTVGAGGSVDVGGRLIAHSRTIADPLGTLKDSDLSPTTYVNTIAGQQSIAYSIPPATDTTRATEYKIWSTKPNDPTGDFYLADTRTGIDPTTTVTGTLSAADASLSTVFAATQTTINVTDTVALTGAVPDGTHTHTPMGTLGLGAVSKDPDAGFTYANAGNTGAHAFWGLDENAKADLAAAFSRNADGSWNPNPLLNITADWTKAGLDTHHPLVSQKLNGMGAFEQGVRTIYVAHTPTDADIPWPSWWGTMPDGWIAINTVDDSLWWRSHNVWHTDDDSGCADCLSGSGGPTSPGQTTTAGGGQSVAGGSGTIQPPLLGTITSSPAGPTPTAPTTGGNSTPGGAKQGYDCSGAPAAEETFTSSANPGSFGFPFPTTDTVLSTIVGHTITLLASSECDNGNVQTNASRGSNNSAFVLWHFNRGPDLQWVSMGIDTGNSPTLDRNIIGWHVYPSTIETVHSVNQLGAPSGNNDLWFGINFGCDNSIVFYEGPDATHLTEVLSPGGWGSGVPISFFMHGMTAFSAGSGTHQPGIIDNFHVYTGMPGWINWTDGGGVVHVATTAPPVFSNPVAPTAPSTVPVGEQTYWTQGYLAGMRGDEESTNPYYTAAMVANMGATAALAAAQAWNQGWVDAWNAQYAAPLKIMPGGSGSGTGGTIDGTASSTTSSAPNAGLPNGTTTTSNLDGTTTTVVTSGATISGGTWTGGTTTTTVNAPQVGSGGTASTQPVPVQSTLNVAGDLDVGGNTTLAGSLTVAQSSNPTQRTYITPLMVVGTTLQSGNTTNTGTPGQSSGTTITKTGTYTPLVHATSQIVNDGVLQQGVIASPTAPASGYGQLYAITVSGIAHPYWMSSDGVAHDLIPDAAPQPANTVFAGPTSGAAAAPAFRTLVAADLPVPIRWELLMTDGVTNPPVPITTEDGTDWLYYG